MDADGQGVSARTGLRVALEVWIERMPEFALADPDSVRRATGPSAYAVGSPAYAIGLPVGVGSCAGAVGPPA